MPSITDEPPAPPTSGWTKDLKASISRSKTKCYLNGCCVIGMVGGKVAWGDRLDERGRGGRGSSYEGEKEAVPQRIDGGVCR